MGRIININGKQYHSFEEMIDKEKNNPNSDIVIWEYQDYVSEFFVNGKRQFISGQGKCHYKGKTYEGAIEHIDGWLVVGGEKVKEL